MASEIDDQDLTRRRSGDAVDAGEEGLSHNLYGQRLGRKGRDTRERIIGAAQTLLSGAAPVPITLSAVAREASLGMTTLYLYFSDLTELLLAVLEPVMATADDAYLDMARAHWPDAALAERCRSFTSAYNGFWEKNTHILHLRNALADQHDERMQAERIRAGTALIGLIVAQMECEPTDTQSVAFDMANVVVAGMERVVTLTTSPEWQSALGHAEDRLSQRMQAVARLLELSIRDQRPGGEGRTTAPALSALSE